jgi:microcystin-dependent protein
VPLETATYLSDLVTSNPAASDPLSNADDHLRLLKATVKATFPNFTAAPLNSTQAQLDAITALLVNGVLRGNGAAPAGLIADFGSTTAPTGWLLCDGQAVSRTTYADLFTAIGTTWGAGDGSTTFNVPNMISRYRRHREVAGLASVVGTLQSPVIQSHAHSVVGNTGGNSVDHTHTFSGTTGTMNSNTTHSHSYTRRGGVIHQDGTNAATVATSDVTDTTSAANIDHTHSYSGTTAGASVAHTHAINFSSGATGDANETRPYSATVLTCIKA